MRSADRFSVFCHASISKSMALMQRNIPNINDMRMYRHVLQLASNDDGSGGDEGEGKEEGEEGGIP